MNRYIALTKIVEQGSFTKAADILGYTQPALSQMITSLEKELSIRLLYRSRYGIRLTIEGKRLYPHIEKIVFQYQSVCEKAMEIRGLDNGTIRIGTLSSISCHWLPELIKVFQNKYPNVHFILHQGDNNSIPEWVRSDKADFGFVNLDVLPNNDARFIKEGEYRAVVPLNHPLANLPDVTLEELAKEPFLVIEEGSRSKPLEAFRQKGLEPDVRLRVHDDYSILSMIETGLGVSILPELVLKKIGYAVAILPIKPVITRKIGLVTKEKKSLPLASKYFIDFLFSQVDKLP